MYEFRIEFSLGTNYIKSGFYGPLSFTLDVNNGDSDPYDFEITSQLYDNNKELYQQYLNDVKKLKEQYEDKGQEISEIVKNLLYAEMINYRNDIKKLKDKYKNERL